MTYEEVRRVEYDGELWDSTESVPHPALLELLRAEDVLVVLRHGGPPYAVVLGVPHQAAVGAEHICDKRVDPRGTADRRASDENAASYALVAYSRLTDRRVPCKLVIMAHATTHDPNKEVDTPYCREALSDATLLLIECHGAGPHRRRSLEISAGYCRLSDPERFGRALWEALGGRCSLGVQKRVGRSEALILNARRQENEGVLEFAALRTCSLIAAAHDGIHALHLEARPEFRKPVDRSNSVTEQGLTLGSAIASAAADYLSHLEEESSGRAGCSDLLTRSGRGRRHPS